MDWAGQNTQSVMPAIEAEKRIARPAIGERLAPGQPWAASLFHGVFPFLLMALFFFPLLLIDHTESGYNSLPVAERRMNLRGLEMVTTEYLNAHPEDFDKLIRIVSNADDALQEEERPVQGAVIEWLDRSMAEEGIAPNMPVYFFLRNVYLKNWQGAYFTQVDAGEREYLFDLMGAAIGGLYRCTCAPPELHKT